MKAITCVLALIAARSVPCLRRNRELDFVTLRGRSS